MSLLRTGLTGALGALLAGCSSNAVVVQDHGIPAPSYFNGDFEYATRKGAIRTEVIGLPFQTNEQALQNRVLALMDKQNRGKPAEFVAGETDSTDPAYKVVVAFNIADRYSGSDLCSGTEGLAMRGPGNPVKVDMAFCIGDQLKSDVQGRVGQAAGLDDPRFADLVRQTTYALIPARDMHDGGGDSDSGVN